MGKMNADDVKVGCYQVLTLVLLSVNFVTVAMSHVVSIFYRHTTKFYCQVCLLMFFVFLKKTFFGGWDSNEIIFGKTKKKISSIQSYFCFIEACNYRKCRIKF